ncbi:MAG: hypothetical protein FWC01_01975 [Treponema sp.]|nr:hypothetical protein [Treponema sp.]MCL2236908.1 hypothetical protein [Treponema sp.]
MKNTVKMIGTVAFTAVIGFLMIACGKGEPVGTYYSKEYNTSYAFSNGKMTLKTGDLVMEADYEIKDGKIITITEYGTAQVEYKLNGRKLTITSNGTTFTMVKQ